MDLNLVVISGRIAAPPEIRELESGARMVRYLVTVRSDRPDRRVDVLPVTQGLGERDRLSEHSEPGRRIWIAGGLQRRFWDRRDGRRSRLEIVAHQIEMRGPGEESPLESQ